MGIVRHGDTAGGIIVSTSNKVLLNGRPIALVGDKVMPHGSPKTPHGHIQQLVGGKSNVLVNGKPVAHSERTHASCGHGIGSSSKDG